MLYELFAIGSIWFWLVIVLELGWLVYCVIDDTALYRSLISIGVFLLTLQLFSNANLLYYILHHPGSLLIVLAMYLIGGCIWTFPKWYLFVLGHHGKYLELRDKFLVSKNLSPNQPPPEEFKDEWNSYYKEHNRYGEDSVVYKPSPRNYKNRILTWMAMWPLSLVWTFANFVGVHFFLYVYYQIVGVLQKISDDIFKNEAFDFQKNETAGKLRI